MENIKETESKVKIHGPRYERNRKYYLKHTHESLRSTLLHNIKSRGEFQVNLQLKNMT